MPNEIRDKLAAIGAELDEGQWSRLPPVARRRLELAPAETSLQRASLAELVRWLKRTFAAAA